MPKAIRLRIKVRVARISEGEGQIPCVFLSGINQRAKGEAE